MLSTLTLTLALLSGSTLTMEAYLERAIERGVPAFNEGSPQACAAIYATALEAISSNSGWGIDEAQRTALGTRLELAYAIEDPVERAWAYRAIIDILLSDQTLTAPELPDASTLFDFSNPQEIERWGVVVDGVMGGRSTGALSVQNDTLLFTGETSLRNNGGFSSIRSRLPSGSVAGFNALRIRVRGDGRTYIIGASTASGRGDSYWTRFDTTADEWVTVTVPINEMVRQYFGTPIQGQLSPSGVRGLEFYIYDKKEGPFRLEVDRIEAVVAGIN